MNGAQLRRIEFGDFQTPDHLALAVCKRLADLGIEPDIVIEPTCGVGSFVMAAAQTFPNAREVVGFEINAAYINTVRERIGDAGQSKRVHVEQRDFFAGEWRATLNERRGKVLVVGNFPWVTNAAQGVFGGSNLPEKSNFHGRTGFDSITGKANFDISEWMLIEVLRWFEDQIGDVAMLVKTAVARKILAHAEQRRAPVLDAFMIRIDAKRAFGASVDACLLVIRLGGPHDQAGYDYTVFDSLDDTTGRRVGHRGGLTVGDLAAFGDAKFLVGESPQKWRSGIKHDASAVMEFTNTAEGLKNGLGDVVQVEDTYLYPLLKGSDVGSDKVWRDKYVLVTQRKVGEETASIQQVAPATWDYLMRHAAQLDARGSSIYAKNPRFSIFGIGSYTFRPWRIAICGLYKVLRFRLVGPIEGRPVMFDDTVYYLSFDSEEEARGVLKLLTTTAATRLLSSLIFWDEKRPIKSSILNVLDWSLIPSADGMKMLRSAADEMSCCKNPLDRGHLGTTQSRCPKLVTPPIL